MFGHNSSSHSTDEQTECACGNIFLDDAVFCRKCGEKRPNVCECGNILKPDAEFCRKCGVAVRKASDKRESGSSEMSTVTTGGAASSSGLHPGLRKTEGTGSK